MLRPRTFQPIPRRAPPKIARVDEHHPEGQTAPIRLLNRGTPPPWVFTRPSGIRFLYTAPAEAWRDAPDRVVRRITPPLPPADSTGPETNPDF